MTTFTLNRRTLLTGTVALGTVGLLSGRQILSRTKPALPPPATTSVQAVSTTERPSALRDSGNCD